MYALLACSWESVRPEDVLTPSEAYASLSAQGFAVQYLRVPVTDGTSPSVSMSMTGVTGHEPGCA